MKSHKRSSNLNTRRKSALDRLEKQLKSGVKPIIKQLGITEPLTDHDIKRIEKEILTLKTKIK